ncbi:B3 domain-containing protein, partial [Mucuna pruriens]
MERAKTKTNGKKGRPAKKEKVADPRKQAGLNGGWRGFSIAHNILQMDVLIFYLVQPSKFKVYIIRSQGSDEVDGALGLLWMKHKTKFTASFLSIVVNGVVIDSELSKKVRSSVAARGGFFMRALTLNWRLE